MAAHVLSQLAPQRESARTLGAAVRPLMAHDVLAQGFGRVLRHAAYAAQMLSRPGDTMSPDHAVLPYAWLCNCLAFLICVRANVHLVTVLVARVAPADGAYDGRGARGAHAGLVLGALVDSQQYLVRKTRLAYDTSQPLLLDGRVLLGVAYLL